MATNVTGVRVVFFGSHKHPSYVVEKCSIPGKDDLQNGEILIKVLMTTICPMDLDHIDGEREVKTPCVLGHEGVGEVVISRRSGNESSVVAPGDRVSFTMISKCGCCCRCREKAQDCYLPSVKYCCSALKDFSGLNGSYSTHMVLKANTNVIRIPSNVSNASASPANCALATMVHAVSFLVSTIGLKQSVAVIQGANLMGLYGCALLNEAGFKHIYCHDISSSRLKLVPKFRGIPVLVEKDYDFDECPFEPLSGTADVVIDVCGDWDVVPYGLSMLRHQGTYIFVGSAHDGRPLEMNVDTILKKCIAVKGIQGYEATHLEKAIEFLSQTIDRYPYDSLISPPYSLQEFHIAVTHARSKLYHRTAIVP